MAKKKPAAKPARTKQTPKKKTATDWAPRFLEALSQTSNIFESCRLAKVARSVVYERRDREPDFAQAMAHALDEAIDRMELEAHRRAFEGCERPVFHQGAECGRIREYSDTLAIFLLKAHRPEKYRERSEVKHTGKVGLQITAQDMSDDDLAAIASQPG